MIELPDCLPSPYCLTDTITSESESVTAQWAETFAERLRPGSWVGLIGTLGMGKSVFARGVARGWGVTVPMPSPSYTLMNLYRGRAPVCHMDLYRLGSADELDFAGLTPYFEGDGICLVEWAERARTLWPPVGWIVSFDADRPEVRQITIYRFGTPD